jgi:hypothetical protein
MQNLVIPVRTEASMLLAHEVLTTAYPALSEWGRRKLDSAYLRRDPEW